MPINKFLYFGDFFAVPIALAVFGWLAFVPRGLAAAPAYGLGLASGVLAWTFAEYWIHRALYHHAPWLSDLHDRHHEAPCDYIGVPSFVSLGIVVVLAYAPFFAIWPTFATGFVSGVMIGYAAYMFVHHATHHWAVAPGDWLYPARVRHLGHHYHDDMHFGVVTGLWDRIFGTAGRRRNRLAGV